jgi:hypothetical protein
MDEVDSPLSLGKQRDYRFEKPKKHATSRQMPLCIPDPRASKSK